MFPSLALQRQHYRRIGIVALVLVVFWHRIILALTLGYTYLAFTFSPAPVLGDGDGWDLINLVAPHGAAQIVPRVIHQARLGDLEMKEKWVTANKTCADLHPAPNWRFELWETERANAFVAEHYPELLETYLGYGQGEENK